jgi:hypothetical protein
MLIANSPNFMAVLLVDHYTGDPFPEDAGCSIVDGTAAKRMIVELDYSAAGIPVRDDLRAAHRAILTHVRSPGTWWTGAQRLAFAAETRNATSCGLCRRRKAALSPGGVDGEHDTLGQLADNVVEVVHRVRTDPARLSRAWFDRRITSGLGEAEYVELIGVITMVTGLDFFARAFGIPPFPLPEPIAGKPSRRLPDTAKPGTAWVPTIAPSDATGPEAGLYGDAPFIPHIVQALSLVPDEVRMLRTSSSAHYLPVAEIGDPSARRALDRMQMELIAARVSVLNECFY